MLSDFSMIINPLAGKSIKKHFKYLDKVHTDIVFGDAMDLSFFIHGGIPNMQGRAPPTYHFQGVVPNANANPGQAPAQASSIDPTVQFMMQQMMR